MRPEPHRESPTFRCGEEVNGAVPQRSPEAHDLVVEIVQSLLLRTRLGEQHRRATCEWLQVHAMPRHVGDDLLSEHLLTAVVGKRRAAQANPGHLQLAVVGHADRAANALAAEVLVRVVEEPAGRVERDRREPTSVACSPLSQPRLEIGWRFGWA